MKGRVARRQAPNSHLPRSRFGCSTLLALLAAVNFENADVCAIEQIPTPKPSSMLLMLIGGVALLICRFYHSARWESKAAVP
jgi:hypothetical protein